jgi:hypothetical protein
MSIVTKFLLEELITQIQIRPDDFEFDGWGDMIDTASGMRWRLWLGYDGFYLRDQNIDFPFWSWAHWRAWRAIKRLQKSRTENKIWGLITKMRYPDKKEKSSGDYI